MSCYAEDVIKVARAEKGYLEKASKSDLDSKTDNAGDKNYTKYARDLDRISGFYNGRKNGVAWCDVFVDWCFVQAFGVANAKRLLCQPNKSCGAGCKYSMQYYKSKGRLVSSPKPGDQIFFTSSDGSSISHTGLVYKVDSKYVYTVEGNTSSESGVIPNGGAVAEKKYSLSYERIAGYGRPAYDTKTNADETKVMEEPKHETQETDDYQCIHTVVQGNTLWGIATKYLGRGKRFREIMELNGMTSTKIMPGDKIKIPKK